MLLALKQWLKHIMQNAVFSLTLPDTWSWNSTELQHVLKTTLFTLLIRWDLNNTSVSPGYDCNMCNIFQVLVVMKSFFFIYRLWYRCN